jgi:alpha-mannosidase
LSESGFGLALLNNSKYGMAVRDDVIRLSLLRSPKAPDPDCDMGIHEMSYALLPHAGGSPHEAGIVQAGFEFNAPVRSFPAASPSSASLVTGSPVHVDSTSVVLNTVKLADDGSGALVLRFYESAGGRSNCQVSLDRSVFTVASVQRCDLLEEPDSDERTFSVDDEGTMALELAPFELLSLRCELSRE